MFLPVKDMTGNQTGEMEVSDAVFAAPVNQPLMHQALVRQLSNARLGTHKTKSRSEVRGGGRKPWRQKGTGRARQGSIRASQWVGGGTVFGPTPRKYTKAMPKKMHRAALAERIEREGCGRRRWWCWMGCPCAEPKTKQAAAMLKALGLDEQSVLFVMAEKERQRLAKRQQFAQDQAMLSGYLNVRDLLGYDVVLMAQGCGGAWWKAWLGERPETGDADASLQCRRSGGVTMHIYEVLRRPVSRKRAVIGVDEEQQVYF